VLRRRLRELAASRQRFGYRRLGSPTGFEPVERSWEGAFPLSEDMARIEGRLRPSNPS